MSEKFHVLIADFLDETSVEVPILGDIASITMARARTEADLRDHLATADAIMLFHDISMLTEATFARAPRCRGVVRAGVGYNNIDLAAAGRHGMAVCNVPDYGTEEVADHAIMLLLAVARHLVIADRSIREGGWDFQIVQKSPRLRGKTLGLLGCGRIGMATALRAKAFGLDVVFFDPYVANGLEKALGIRRVFRFEELLEQSQYLSVHCYLDENTRHLVNARALGRMPKDSIVINTARGPIVDQTALVEALETGHILGAGLDVFEREPLDDERLRNHPRVVLTPHSAFYSIEGYAELRRKTSEEVRRLLLGEPPRNVVNRGQIVGEPRARLSV